MTLARLSQQFSSRTLGKPDYIAAMLERHNTLFEYSEFIAHTDIESIEIREGGPVFHLKNMPFSMECPAAEARVAPIEILNFSQYEPECIRAITPLLDGCRQILDIGANIGWFSLWFSATQPAAHIHAFEPMPGNFDYLNRNVARNRQGSAISLYNYGLSDAGGVAEFYLYPTGTTNASLENVSCAADSKKVVGLTMKLDDWAQNYQVAPDFIKCDVEGAEFLVFKGGRDTLATHRPVVFTEMLRKWSKSFHYHPNEVIGFFSELGYACFSIGERGLSPFQSMDENTVETNFVFLHQEKHRLQIESTRESR